MDMKKSFIILFSSALLLSSCGTYTGSGAYVGGSFGSILGSAIGGIAGGPRGSDIGTIIGMAGGVAVGASIGSHADQQQEKQREQRRERIYSQTQKRHDSNEYDSNQQSHYPDDSNKGSGFDSSNSGDDRLYDFNGPDYTGNYTAQQPTSKLPSNSSTVDEINSSQLEYSPQLEIVNARFVDENLDGKLNRNETCKIIFEIMNRGSYPVYDVVPTVIETTGNKHIYVSPNIHVEKIDSGKGIRYTAVVKADSRLKEGSAKFCVSVIHGDRAISKVNEFNIPTTK